MVGTFVVGDGVGQLADVGRLGKGLGELWPAPEGGQGLLNVFVEPIRKGRAAQRQGGGVELEETTDWILPPLVPVGGDRAK